LAFSVFHIDLNQHLLAATVIRVSIETDRRHRNSCLNPIDAVQRGAITWIDSGGYQ
jgi:hypothetical protein